MYQYPPFLHWGDPNIIEAVNSIRSHSRFRVWPVNTFLGFPAILRSLRFQVVIMIHSVFSFYPYSLNDKFLRYLEEDKTSYKIAFFQDEYRFCKERLEFINRYKIDCVYTLLEPLYWKEVYLRHTNVPKLKYALTGYVSNDLIKKASKFGKPDNKRPVDIGYRGRDTPFLWGKGGREKYEIAPRFLEHAAGSGLNIDIETAAEKRFRGDAWYRFLANCKACLGVESGVSIFDTEGTALREYERLIAENLTITFEEASQRLFCRYENKIPYRTVSPRHFEAAAFRVCQILYEGDYQGILKPLVHYIPLKKDFSNFTEVMHLFRNEQFRREISENCYRDLIASGKYSYHKFVSDLDDELTAAGLTPQIAGNKAVSTGLSLDLPVRLVLTYWKLFRDNPRVKPFPEFFSRLFKRNRT